MRDDGSRRGNGSGHAEVRPPKAVMVERDAASTQGLQSAPQLTRRTPAEQTGTQCVRAAIAEAPAEFADVKSEEEFVAVLKRKVAEKVSYRRRRRMSCS